MEKLPLCRVCLAGNVRMYLIVNKNLRELYEQLTDNPFVTEDSRPMLACFFCCTKLKQCFQFQRKCLEAEELFAQMMNEDYEPNQDPPEFCSGLIQTAIENISIVGECQTENIAIKEELSAVCEGQDDYVEPKEEQQSYDVEDIPVQHFESDSEDDLPLTEFKIEVEELEVLRQTPKLDVITDKQKNIEKPDTKALWTTEKCTHKTVSKFKKTVIDTQHGVHCSFDTNFRKKGVTKFKKLKKEIVINRHQSRCVKGKSFKCDMCERSYNRRDNLTAHIRTHTGEKPFKRLCVKEKSFKCDMCERSFTRRDNLITHIRTHTGEKPFKCDVCQRCFSVKRSLSSHIRTHTGEKPHKCDVCQRRFSDKSYLTNHIRIHAGRKSYHCDICQRSFNCKSYLIKHIRMHAGEKPFKCDVCQSRFSQKFALKRHSRRHTGEKPYKCDVCERSFMDKRSIKKHTCIQVGEKPYKCKICQRRFHIKANLTRHVCLSTATKD